MSFGKMNRNISIVRTTSEKDNDGFVTLDDTVIANVRAYYEERHGTEIWANRAAFTTASALFRFRSIPHITVDTTNVIICDGIRYSIFSVEDVKGRGMYIEVLADRIESSVR